MAKQAPNNEQIASSSLGSSSQGYGEYSTSLRYNLTVMTSEAALRIKALIFDFDGLILDTETPDFRVWQAIYQEHGFELPHDEWGKIVGGWGLSFFDAAEHLTLLSQGRLDTLSLRDRHRS
ncbi:MAG TPA: hypothetical protein VJM08_18080, partial [Anaerolineales bacterium]|nr:hypothetical protein [Anaerolineales bacterium]